MVTTTKKPRPSNYYVDKDTFMDQVVLFQQKVRDAKETGKTVRQPDVIGKTILQMCDRMAKRPNFRNYTYIEEMKGEAILNCTKAVHTFSPEHAKKNPFGYFSRIIWNSFLGVMDIEKKAQETKIKSMFDPINEPFSRLPGDNSHYPDGKDDLSDFYYGGKDN